MSFIRSLPHLAHLLLDLAQRPLQFFADPQHVAQAQSMPFCKLWPQQQQQGAAHAHGTHCNNRMRRGRGLSLVAGWNSSIVVHARALRVRTVGRINITKYWTGGTAVKKPRQTKNHLPQRLKHKMETKWRWIWTRLIINLSFVDCHYLTLRGHMVAQCLTTRRSQI